jgi:hypothetical protein
VKLPMVSGSNSRRNPGATGLSGSTRKSRALIVQPNG